MTNCPQCGGELTSYEYHGIKFDICNSCNAVLLKKENFELLCKKMDTNKAVIDLFTIPSCVVNENARECSYCSNKMEKIYIDGIILDRCKNCNTLVFDNGELSKYFAKFSDKYTEIVSNAKFIKSLTDDIKFEQQAQNTTQKRYKQLSAIKITSNETEKNVTYFSGYSTAIFMIVILLASFLGFFSHYTTFFFLSAIVDIILLFSLCGFKILKPKEAFVCTVFGKYTGTLKNAGFYWINPFAQILPVSLKARTLNNERQKINDLSGNPVEIGIMVTWEVSDTAKATFNVECYPAFLSAQCDSALRNITRLYPYDAPENSNIQSLRGDSIEISERLKIEIQNNVSSAGIKILDARITHLAYSSEIAAAMLQRQQANAIIDAKRSLVEGAVGMVEMALDRLISNPNIILDDKIKTNMVNNLLVTLCANKESQPVIRNDIII